MPGYIAAIYRLQPALCSKLLSCTRRVPAHQLISKRPGGSLWGLSRRPMWIVDRGAVALLNRAAVDLFGAKNERDLIGSPGVVLLTANDDYSAAPLETTITRLNGSISRVRLVNWIAGPDVRVFEAELLDVLPIDEGDWFGEPGRMEELGRSLLEKYRRLH